MPWEPTEVQAVERHMSRFIKCCIVPAKNDCEKCLRAEPEALKKRDWQNLKFYVYNRITSYKKKMQHKQCSNCQQQSGIEAFVSILVCSLLYILSKYILKVQCMFNAFLMLLNECFKKVFQFAVKGKIYHYYDYYSGIVETRSDFFFVL